MRGKRTYNQMSDTGQDDVLDRLVRQRVEVEDEDRRTPHPEGGAMQLSQRVSPSINHHFRARGRTRTSAELPVPIDGSGDRRGRPRLATREAGGSDACVSRGDQRRSASTRPAGELIQPTYPLRSSGRPAELAPMPCLLRVVMGSGSEVTVRRAGLSSPAVRFGLAGRLSTSSLLPGFPYFILSLGQATLFAFRLLARSLDYLWNL